jgi:hypothetical protein
VGRQSSFNLSNQEPIVSCWAIHVYNSAENFHSKQDGEKWIGQKKTVINLGLIWVPGHYDFSPNKPADNKAKKALQGDSSKAQLLPPILCKSLPASISALCQDFLSKLQKQWK